MRQRKAADGLSLRRALDRARRGARLAWLRIAERGRPSFHCPICAHRGPFLDFGAGPGVRRHARCPRCGSLERHRLQMLVLLRLREQVDFSGRSILHVAPEAWLERVFDRFFARHVTLDLSAAGVGVRGDLRALPFRAGSFDAVFASHVLEHIREDRTVLGEVRRVLRPGGFALLPVPIVGRRTVEYPAARSEEHSHVRAPGLDYYDRYREVFSRVEHHRSGDYPEEAQTFVFRRNRQTAEYGRLGVEVLEGDRHAEQVPVCWV